jgi:hypothetical protein
MPDLKTIRDRASVGDVLVLAAIAFFAVMAILLHNSVAGLGEMATGLKDTGVAIEQSGKTTATEIRTSVGRAADAVGALPLVGGSVKDAVRDTANKSADAVERETRANGRLLVESGRQGEEDARTTARLVGWMSFLIPTILLLAQWLPRRLPEWRAAEIAAFD